MSDREGEYYTAKANDCMSSIADLYGFFWKTLWFHSQNQALRRLRKNPNVLLENDQVWIPAKQTRWESKNTDARHKFVLLGVPTKFRIRFADSGKPRANVPYVLTVDGAIFTGSTDSNGKIEHAIPPNAQQGTLVLGQGDQTEIFNLDLGALAPVSEPAGAIARIRSLGYHCAIDDKEGLTQALRSFQAENHLQVSGKLDASTQSKLTQVFGC